jgi:hypothetical protein
MERQRAMIRLRRVHLGRQIGDQLRQPIDLIRQMHERRTLLRLLKLDLR